MSERRNQTHSPLGPLSRRQFLRTAAIAGVSAGSIGPFLAACGKGGGGTPQTSGSPQQGGDLIFGRAWDPRTIDPSSSEDNEAIWTVLNLYDCLYTVSRDGHGSDPWLVVKSETSSDQLTWTFSLRPGVKFCDGRPLTAEDVKFTLDRAHVGYNGYIDAAIDSVDAKDASTVVIHTKHPWGPLVGDLSLYANAIIPKDFRGATEGEFFKNPIGTGPFMLDHWTKGQELKIVKNPHYWQEGKPHLDSVTFTIVADDNTRVLQLRGGEAHVIYFPPFSVLSSLQQTPGIKVDSFPSTWVSFILSNETRPHFGDVHVRRAISYAIDRDSIIKSVLFGHGQPAASFFSPSWGFYNPDTPALWYDPAKAKQELSMSGFPNGFSAEYAFVAGDTVNAAIAQIVQANLKDILGIDLSIRSFDESALTAMTKHLDYDMSPDYYTLDIADPDENVPWAIDPVRGGDKSLGTMYNNSEVINWALQAERTVDPKERGAIYAKMQNQVAMDCPFIELYYQPYIYAHRDQVGGFTVYPTGNYHLEDVWLSS